MTAANSDGRPAANSGFGWTDDWCGYWIDQGRPGCASTGYNAAPAGSAAGAWCCNNAAPQVQTYAQFNQERYWSHLADIPMPKKTAKLFVSTGRPEASFCHR